ncbi:MAG: TetR/AcrR family transcriptional regulator [Acetobacteraceae bacterium]
MSSSPPTIRERILDAAFGAFMRLGYGGTSTAQIARLARVSKRDLYANFGSKQAMLASCVAERAERMRRPLDLPVPTDQDSLHRTLTEFGMAVVREVSRPEVLATYRLAILEAENAPDVAHTLDRHGREANNAALIELLSAASTQGLLGSGEPADMAGLFLSLLMGGGLLVRLLMRVAPPPGEAEAQQRAELAAKCLFGLYDAAG